MRNFGMAPQNSFFQELSEWKARAHEWMSFHPWPSDRSPSFPFGKRVYFNNLENCLGTYSTTIGDPVYRHCGLQRYDGKG